jgi:hypothetical protein
MKTEQKLIRVRDEITGDLENYLSNGWKIKKISASGMHDKYATFCYVLLERRIKKEKNEGK